MAFTSIVQILKLNEVRKGVGKLSGNPYEMQDAECILLNDDGTVAEVGVLDMPKELREKGYGPGTYTGTFSLRASKAKDGGRRIGAVLVGLTWIPASKSAAQ
jgi:hypothetical protein